MPRIAAASIKEHVAQQRARILDQALALFQSKGYAGVDIGMIARAVGLKRSSFYRYFTNKDDVLIACVEQAMAPVIERNQVIAKGLRPARDRVLAWVDVQFEFATGPDHATYTLTKEVRAVAPQARKQILKLHVGVYKTLSNAVSDFIAGSGRNAAVVATLISGMVQSAAALALENSGADDIQAELRRSVLAVLDSASESITHTSETSERRA